MIFCELTNPNKTPAVVIGRCSEFNKADDRMPSISIYNIVLFEMSSTFEMLQRCCHAILYLALYYDYKL